MKYFIYCRKSQEAEDRQILSLESQSDEVAKLVACDSEVEIVETFTEACSAKAPGRPEFNRMISRLEKGEAEGIIAWHPDRLARNSMDGGNIIYLLDQGVLKDLKFCNYTFENTSQGKFMLNIIFGYSKYYSDNLSENVRRGMRTKLKNGWRPGKAPIGYRNCPDTQTIVTEPDEAEVVQQLFSWCLAGETNVCELHRRLRDDLHFRTRQRKGSGGRPLSRTQVYRTLINPFYAGWVVWNGNTSKGAHKPLVSNTDFAKVQRVLGCKIKTRASKRDHTYRGLFRCGACGKAVTAETKTKPSGRTYTYYHCTRVHSRCQQPSVEERSLNEQVERFVGTLKNLAPKLEGLDVELKAPAVLEEAKKSQQRRDGNIAKVNRQLTNLTDLRLSDCLSDEEFQTKRRDLQIAKAKLVETTAELPSCAEMFEPLEMLKKLCARPVFFFRQATSSQKRELIRILCSNPLIMDKKPLFLNAEFPQPDADLLHVCIWRGNCTDSRTKPDHVLSDHASAPGGILELAQPSKKPLDIAWLHENQAQVTALVDLMKAVGEADTLSRL